jgi:hypothetical protein
VSFAFLRPRLRGHLFLLAGALALIAASSSASAATPAATALPPTSVPSVTPAATEPQAPVQLADEIVRRLRRLGLNFTIGRIANPYDPIGEVC